MPYAKRGRLAVIDLDAEHSQMSRDPAIAEGGLLCDDRLDEFKLLTITRVNLLTTLGGDA